MENSSLIADTQFLLALSVTTTTRSGATTVRRHVPQTTARETQSATRARTASAPTVRQMPTVLQERTAATDSVQSPVMTNPLQLLQLRLRPRAPTHLVLQSAAQTTTVRRV